MKIPVIIIIVLIISLPILWWLFGSNIELFDGSKLSETSIVKIENEAVSLGVGNMLLLKYPNGSFGGIAFTSMGSAKKVNYKSWFIVNGKNKKNYQIKEGVVFEKYWRTRTSENSYNVIDIGGENLIKVGDSFLSWSASTWIYIPNGISFCIQSSKVSNPDFLNKNLKWIVSSPN